MGSLDEMMEIDRVRDLERIRQREHDRHAGKCFYRTRRYARDEKRRSSLACSDRRP
jgi:Zn-finger nucleic acid-binding protein